MQLKILQIHVIAKTIRQQDSVLEESIRKCEKTIACVVLSVEGVSSNRVTPSRGN